VSLGYVSGFVGHDCRQFIRSSRTIYKAGVNINRSSRDREGIKDRFIDHEIAVIEGLRPHGGEYSPSHDVYIALHLRITDELQLFFRLTAKFATDSYVLVLAGRAYPGKR